MYSVAATSNITTLPAVGDPCAEGLDTLRQSGLRQTNSGVVQATFLVFTLTKVRHRQGCRHSRLRTGRYAGPDHADADADADADQQ